MVGVKRREPPFRVHDVLWIAMLASTIIISALSTILSRRELSALADEQVTAFTFAGLVMVAASWFLPKAIARQKLMSAKLSSLSEAEVERLLLPAMIVRYALLEGVAIVGFVLASLGASREQALPYFLLAAVGILANRPTSHRLKSLAS